MERRTPWLGYLCVILSAVIFGCMPLGANFLYAQGVTPMSLVFLRNLLSLPVLALLCQKQGGLRISRGGADGGGQRVMTGHRITSGQFMHRAQK